MAKLEDRVTPSELLEAIRSGAVKSELIKQFRTTDQELAVMLHSLYRKGEVSKEEFNDFFKGVAYRRSQATAGVSEVAVPAVTEEQAPSEILASLTAAADKDSPVEPVAEPLPVSVGAHPATIAVPSSEPVTPTDGPRPEIPNSPVTEDAGAAAAVPLMPHPDIQDRPFFPGVGMAAGGTLDSAGVASFLETMLARLNSIEGRLAEIEKKLKTS